MHNQRSLNPLFTTQELAVLQHSSPSLFPDCIFFPAVSAPEYFSENNEPYHQAVEKLQALPLAAKQWIRKYLNQLLKNFSPLELIFLNLNPRLVFKFHPHALTTPSPFELNPATNWRQITLEHLQQLTNQHACDLLDQCIKHNTSLPFSNLT